MSDDCQELKNINFKSMLLSGNNNKINIAGSHNNEGAIDDYLEKEIQANKKEPWVKLNKTMKINKIDAYVETYSSLHKDYKLTATEIKNLKRYLIDCIDKKRLSKVKDITYDKDAGVIKAIPGLEFNKTSRKFVLASTDKKTSTLKSLAPKNTAKLKTTRKQKSSKNEIKDKIKDSSNNKIDKS